MEGGRSRSCLGITASECMLTAARMKDLLEAIEAEEGEGADPAACARRPARERGKNVGHRSRQATELYAHLAPDALKHALDELALAMRRAVESGDGGGRWLSEADQEEGKGPS